MGSYEGIRTVPNQRVITTNKAKCGSRTSDEYYTPINLIALEAAMQRLSANAFKMWVYLGKNQNNYTFALSKVDTMNWCNFSSGTYANAFKELIDEGYLVCKSEGSNHYDFFEMSQEQEQEAIITVHKTEPTQEGFLF